MLKLNCFVVISFITFFRACLRYITGASQISILKGVLYTSWLCPFVSEICTDLWVIFPDVRHFGAKVAERATVSVQYTLPPLSKFVGGFSVLN